MLAVQIKLDEKSIAEAQHILRGIPKAMPRVLRRAINRCVDTAATDLKRKTSEQISLKKGEIAKGISKRKASFANLTGSVAGNAYRPGLAKFPGTRQTHKGVKYRISRAEGRKILEQGFLATMPSGHRGAFVRRSQSRLPIIEAHGPSIWYVITNTPGLLAAATKRAGDQLRKNINDQIGVELRRWRKK